MGRAALDTRELPELIIHEISKCQKNSGEERLHGFRHVVYLITLHT